MINRFFLLLWITDSFVCHWACSVIAWIRIGMDKPGVFPESLELRDNHTVLQGTERIGAIVFSTWVIGTWLHIPMSQERKIVFPFWRGKIGGKLCQNLSRFREVEETPATPSAFLLTVSTWLTESVPSGDDSDSEDLGSDDMNAW